VAREVVLVPGLWMPAAAMSLLAARLGRHGYVARLFACRGRAPMVANVERLARYARESLQGRPAHFIGHSLGGVLVLQTLGGNPDIPVASAVLLGAPVRGCLAGRRFTRGALGRWITGAAGASWAEGEARWQRPEPLGVVAGTFPLGLGRAFGSLPGANDGVVRVDETTVEGMAARALVPVGHSLLIVSSRVGKLVERFLGSGRFE
jgi:pimeloyl-ACP methyl ester carboxylesterase